MEKKQLKLAVQMFNFVVGGDWEQIRSQEEAQDLLTQLANAGYDGVEWCSFQLGKEGIDLAKMKEHMDRSGLSTCGLHFHFNNWETLEKDCKTAIDRCLTLGTDKVIFAYSVPSTFGIESKEPDSYTPEQIDAWIREADRVIDALEKAAEGTGIRVLYHNHAAEFLTGSNGQCFLDAIHAPAKEFDVYWVAKGLDGKVSSALDYIREHKEQAVLLHIKDGLNGSVHTGEMCGWGKGTYPLQEILDFAKETGLSWVVVENDAPLNFGTNGLEDALESAAYAKTLRL